MGSLNPPRRCPESASNFWVNLGGALLFLSGLIVFRTWCPRLNTLTLTVIVLILTTLPIVLFDIFVLAVQRRSTTGLQPELRRFYCARFLTKMAGLGLTLSVLLGIYYLIYFFTGSKLLGVFFAALKMIISWGLILVILYFYWIDRHQVNGHDEYWQTGCLLTGQWKMVDRNVLIHHVKTWLIKGFFTPYVFYFLLKYIESWNAVNWHHLDALKFYNTALDMLYMVDILFGVLGYVLTCRWLDNQIRSTDPTFLGWLVCLICYGSFNTYFGIGLFDYDDGLDWNHWAGHNPVLFHGLGLSIVGLTVIYSLATVAIGTRMSNLTYRGIITSGPYRFCKHPAYAAKVASWWLITLPFLSLQGPISAVKHSAALIFISFIYYLRAVTEENHLSNYPEYVEYAQWINTHGIFSPLTNLLPALKYSPEKTKKWGSVLKNHDQNTH